MRRDVITVPAGATVWELATLFTARGITGVPVVDEKGELVGVVSQTDIVRHFEELVQLCQAGCDFYADPEQADARPARRIPCARDLMSPKVIEADGETQVEELGRIMMNRSVHRIIITREKRIVGIVTTMDLLKVL
jgi:CBS domain-containing protein